MARPPYSARFVFEQGLSVPANRGVCPVGKRRVIRDIDIYANVGSSSIVVLVAIVNTGLGIFPTFCEGKFTGFSSDVVQWRGRQVYYAGEAIYINTPAAIDITISGYELDDP